MEFAGLFSFIAGLRRTQLCCTPTPAREPLVHLILMRHGIAEDGTPDDARKLTHKGERRVEMMARLLDRFGIRPDVILTSHRVRAIDTARIVADTMDLDSPIAKTDAVDLMGSWDRFEAVVNSANKDRQEKFVVMAVGHQPQFGMLTNMALHGDEATFDLRKAGCVGIRFSGAAVAAGEGELRYYLTPSLAKRI